jgi:hypothetical protein
VKRSLRVVVLAVLALLLLGPSRTRWPVPRRAPRFPVGRTATIPKALDVADGVSATVSKLIPGSKISYGRGTALELGIGSDPVPLIGQLSEASAPVSTESVIGGADGNGGTGSRPPRRANGDAAPAAARAEVRPRCAWRRPTRGGARA